MKNKEITIDQLAQERTLLAGERTFSAWLRTTLASMAGGIAILRLINFKTDTHRIVAHIIGEILILWGCIVIFYHRLIIKKCVINLLRQKILKVLN